MGTRSLTVFYNNYWPQQDETEVAVMYKQYDGYPSGLGDDLVDLLRGVRIVNGIGGDVSNIANGMPCLAAQVVSHFKCGGDPSDLFSKGIAGGSYLYPAGTRDCGEEYIYEIRCAPQVGSERDRAIHLTVKTTYGTDDVLYEGLLDEFESTLLEE